MKCFLLNFGKGTASPQNIFIRHSFFELAAEFFFKENIKKFINRL